MVPSTGLERGLIGIPISPPLVNPQKPTRYSLEESVTIAIRRDFPSTPHFRFSKNGFQEEEENFITFVLDKMKRIGEKRFWQSILTDDFD